MTVSEMKSDPSARNPGSAPASWCSSVQSIHARAVEESHVPRKTCGPLPALDPDKIKRVMRWHRRWIRFSQRQGTSESFAQSLGLTVPQLRRALKGDFKGLELSVAKRLLVRQWKGRRRQFLARCPTAAALAKSLGVSRSTIFCCIEKQGKYRSTQGRPATSGRRQREADTGEQKNLVSEALRGWRRVPQSNFPD